MDIYFILENSHSIVEKAIELSKEDSSIDTGCKEPFFIALGLLAEEGRRKETMEHYLKEKAYLLKAIEILRNDFEE